MIIERIEVQEGFLDGLDITFDRGLNVIIGARGVGKTSVLELIRYALRLPNLDGRRKEINLGHAESILRGGRVTVSYTEDERRFTVSRSAEDPTRDTSGQPADVPLMLGQNELEGIGLDPGSRLRLLDSLAGIETSQNESEIADLSEQIESITRLLRALAVERDALMQDEVVRANVFSELRDAQAAEEALKRDSNSEIEQLRKEVSSALRVISEHRQKITDVSGFSEELDESSKMLRRSFSQFDFVVHRAFDSFHSENFTRLLVAASENLGSVAEMIGEAFNASQQMIERERSRIAEIEDNIRPRRQLFETLQQGANEAAQLTAKLERQMAELQNKQIRRNRIEDRINRLDTDRDRILSRIDELGERHWIRRVEAAREISKQFRPRINISLDHFGDRTEYIEELANSLKNSGLQYNSVAAWLAERITPTEMVKAIETRNTAIFATAGELTSSRVDKLMSHLMNSDALGRILAVRVADTVDFELLVGREYRKTETLSTGQRCSVILPILLANPNQALLLDQPEDHLDNAYLVENTIRSLRGRTETAQTIVVTHNANIPVLGDASRLVALESDGRRGYIRAQGGLSDRQVVDAITDLMEGGKEAFARRVAFYRER